MRLKIQTKNTIMNVEAENVVVHTNGGEKIFFEISCPNHDTYRFTYSTRTPKERAKFIKTCDNIMDALSSHRESFFCSLLDFNVKFEKSGRCSHLE